jgi:hypothetical protein
MFDELNSAIGIDLSRRFYQDVGLPMLQRRFPDLIPYLAVGRVGEGSECFGFDDSLSRDHDFGPGFCLWLEDSLWPKYKSALAAAYWSLPDRFDGFVIPKSGPFLTRVGPFSISHFYAQFLGGKSLPQTVEQWFSLPQEPLATCTNGIVFADPSGVFTSIRTRLLAYYPEQVRLKKLAAHCALAAQAGQYNYPRCMRRGEHCAAIWALNSFQYHYMAAAFLLNRRYMPFGKWAFRAFRQLPLLGDRVAQILKNLSPEIPETSTNIEAACHLMADELYRQQLSDSQDSFLLAHADSVQHHVTNASLAALPLMSWKTGWQF